MFNRNQKNQSELTAKFMRTQCVIFGDCTNERTIAALVKIDGKDAIAKGRALQNELVPGLCYRFFGSWKVTEKYGNQFCFTSFCPSVALSEEGVVSYLQRCAGIGTKRAKAIWNMFGEKSLDAIKESDKSLLKISGLTQEIIASASETLIAMQSTEAVTTELHTILDGSGIPHRIRHTIVEDFGTDAANVIAKNPFVLMDYSGVGFSRADHLYQKIGLPMNTPERQGYCLHNLIQNEPTKSTWIDSVSTAQKSLQKQFQDAIGSGHDFSLAVDFGDEREFYEHRTGYIADKDSADTEVYIAYRMDEMLRDTDVTWNTIDWNTVADLSTHQKEEVKKATAKKAGILSGAPGTGKTYTVAALIKAVGQDDCVVCAPTGKAAVRMTQMLSDAGLDIDAQTIHATLMCMPTEYGFEFLHTEENPLPYKYVIVDEASMLSGNLTQSLLRAIGPETHLLLVGDPDQLPPVEIGATLRDLIAAGIPNGHLTEIIRNDGQIVKACHEIRNSRTFIPAFNVLATPEQNLVCINKMTTIDKTLRTLIGNRTANEVQIIVAVNSKTKVALDVVNREAKSIWNPSASLDNGHKLEIGDKVLCSKNGDVPLAVQKNPKEKKTWRVANGDIGFVREFRNAETIIELDGATVAVPWTHETKVSIDTGFTPR